MALEPAPAPDPPPVDVVKEEADILGELADAVLPARLVGFARKMAKMLREGQLPTARQMSFIDALYRERFAPLRPEGGTR